MGGVLAAPALLSLQDDPKVAQRCKNKSQTNPVENSELAVGINDVLSG